MCSQRGALRGAGGGAVCGVVGAGGWGVQSVWEARVLGCIVRSSVKRPEGVQCEDWWVVGVHCKEQQVCS